MQGRLARMVAEIPPTDVSTLIALRALVARDDGGHEVARPEWHTRMREEYRRWYGPPRGHTEAHGELGSFQDAETQHYLDEQVLSRLRAEEVVELLGGDQEPHENGAGGWSTIRLSPWVVAEVGGGRHEALALLDHHIGAILTRQEDDSAAVRAEAAGAVHDDAAQEEADLYDYPRVQIVAVPEPEPEPAPVRRGPIVGGLTLRATGLVKSYRKKRVVNEVDIEVTQGEIVGLLGPNGAGKTTSFYMMVGLISPDRGNVYIGDRKLTGVPMYRRARAGIGYLAQEASVFRKLTVEQNVMAILQTLGIPRAEQKRRLEALLDELSIKHVRKSYAYLLSGGERRRLEITRALVGDPKFMLLDEPFAGVDPIAVHDIQQIVADLRRRGIGVLISDHNVEQTLDIVDRAYIMYEGRVRVSGTVSELVWSDEVADLYLGPTLAARMRERYPNPYEERADELEAPEPPQ
ncbi:MAG TPA: LPS export ABC transporter ATP-binding protein [Longimicrobium sp.]|nr:LPS export ABC transporter ATP-binding protein [Longimicrobium sp.]